MHVLEGNVSPRLPSQLALGHNKFCVTGDDVYTPSLSILIAQLGFVLLPRTMGHSVGGYDITPACLDVKFNSMTY